MNLLSWAEQLRGVTALRDVVDLHIKDTVAAFLVGLKTEEGRRIARDYASECPSAMAAIARLSECDAIHLPSCITPDPATVASALSLADGNYERLHGAVAAGCAAGLALGRAVGGTKALAHGVWPSLLAAPLMAAVSVSIARSDDIETLAHAMARALTFADGRAHAPQPAVARWIRFADAVTRGIKSAETSQCTDLSLLTHAWLTEHAGHSDIDMKMFEAPPPSLAEVGFKPFSIARQALNAVRAFQRLLIGHKHIESVDVFVPSANAAMLSRPFDAQNRLSRLSNMSFQIATFAITPEALYDPERPVTPPVLDFARRVSVRADPALDTHFPERWPARVAIRCGGTMFEETVIAAPMDHDGHDLPQQLSNKWRRMLTPEDLRDFIETSASPAELWQRIEARVRMAATSEG